MSFTKSIKKYIIHLENSTDRIDIVNDIISKTGAVIFDAVYSKNGVDGCFQSHLQIYKKDPEESVLIFEDDCEIIDPNLMNIIDENYENFDIIYLGTNYLWFGDNVNNKLSARKDIDILDKEIFSFGSHAYWISSKVRKIFIEYNDKNRINIPIDNLLNHLQKLYDLKVWRNKDIYKYCRQKLGMKSIITQRPRFDYYYQ